VRFCNLLRSTAHAFVSIVAIASAPSVQAEPLPRPALEIRTLDVIRSRHTPTREIQAELIRPLLSDREVLMPVRTRLFGRIEQSRSVGIGLRRERASIQMLFTPWEAPDGSRHPLHATPLAIDNAREQVDAEGRIQGILAASNPLGISRGLWFRPSLRLLRTPGVGGAGGTTWLNLALGPEGAAGLFGARLLLTRLPDPEIDLPAGTEMTLELHCAEADQSWDTLPAPAQLEDSLAGFLAEQPAAVRKPDDTAVGDIINLALIGSQQQVEAAFEAAGWSTAQDLDRKSFARSYTAFTQRQGYPEAPVSRLHYQGRPPDLVFQKSLNSIAKRHHVRLWNVTPPTGEDIWLAAATHDITVGFNSKNFGLLHKIDANVDRERSKVAGDLDFAGAVTATAVVERDFPLAAGIQSDLALAVVTLQAPAAARLHPTRTAAPKPSLIHRLARRLILEGRQYLLRDNPYYLTFAAGRKLLHRSSGTLLTASTNSPEIVLSAPPRVR
jgi:hypothetical protein